MSILVFRRNRDKLWLAVSSTVLHSAVKRQTSHITSASFFFYGYADAAVSRRAWRPYMWPIKAIMVFGILMMLMQAVSEFFKDIFRIRGEEI